jgi:hypothetical protein
MRVLGVPYCPVCSEALVWNVYDKTDPIEAHTPASATLTLAQGSSQQFSFTGPKPVPNTQNVSWFRDGSPLASGVTSVTVTGAQLGAGNHTIEVRTQDATTLVRRDPNLVLGSSFTWTVTVPSSGTGGAGTGGRGTGGRGTGGAATGGRGGSAGAGGAGGGGGAVAPCTGLCAGPTSFSLANYNSGNLGTGATCHQTLANVVGTNCGNFVSPRTFRINDVPVTCNGGNVTMPPKRNGGFCFQASAGNHPWAYFATF